jgi:hypothetical protein
MFRNAKKHDPCQLPARFYNFNSQLKDFSMGGEQNSNFSASFFEILAAPKPFSGKSGALVRAAAALSAGSTARPPQA